MSQAAGAKRRAWSGVLCAGLALLAWVVPSVAQDPRTTEVQGAARAWLRQADQLDGAATWAAAGAKFKSAMTPARWTEALRAARAPWGAVEQRALTSTRFDTAFAGAPRGDYALVQFRTAYAKKSDGHETVTLEREPDGTWRVIGYFIR